MWYNLDVYKLTEMLLPGFLRKNRIKAFAKSLLTQVKDTYQQWLENRRQNLYKLSHTGQVYSLRNVLNDRFDPYYRRIEIHNGNRFTRAYIYTHSEQMPVYLGSIFLHQRTDYADTGVDFIVKVPWFLLSINNYEMKSLIDFYKQDVKRYKIENL